MERKMRKFFIHNKGKEQTMFIENKQGVRHQLEELDPYVTYAKKNFSLDYELKAR